VSHFKPNYFQRRSKPQGPKANERIRAIDVQVIGSDGNNLGTLPLNKAIEIAKGEGLDLIEISPNANPPVCKIMDMGKYKYDLQKKTNIAKKKTKSSSFKRNQDETWYRCSRLQL
jgi:translation initiation factor IF-3